MFNREIDLRRQIAVDLQSKAVFLMGPRQVGKTTFSKSITPKFTYFNFDIPLDRLSIIRREWPKDSPLLILDEIHKMRNWKNFLKGIVDNKEKEPPLFVTGSARMDTIRKVGDSLAGRYFLHHLNPICLKDLREFDSPTRNLKRLLTVSGFPEPFLKDSTSFFKRWQRTHLDIILRQDLPDLENVRDIASIETLVELLRERVGSPISFASLSRDLQKDASTIKRWMQILENLFIVFRVSPYHRNIARSILKEPKYYFYNVALVEEEGARLENLVALCLRKELDTCQDLYGEDSKLYYLRTKEGKEIDFLPCFGKKPLALIEAKTSDSQVSSAFQTFDSYFPDTPRYQLVKDLEREKDSIWNVKVRNMADWLTSKLDFQSH